MGKGKDCIWFINHIDTSGWSLLWSIVVFSSPLLSIWWSSSFSLVFAYALAMSKKIKLCSNSNWLSNLWVTCDDLSLEAFLLNFLGGAKLMYNDMEFYPAAVQMEPTVLVSDLLPIRWSEGRLSDILFLQHFFNIDKCLNMFKVIRTETLESY